MLKKFWFNIFFSGDQKKEYFTYQAQKEIIQEYLDYLKLGIHLPVTHKIKQNNIQKCAEESNYQVFVETGTYLGDMVEAQKKHFKKLYSIELGEELFQNAVNRFKGDAHIRILQGDSGKVLKQVLAELSEPALFWLDGHYSSGVTAISDKETPILEELEAIFGSPYPHGILIDDARLFVGKYDYPSIDELCIMVRKSAPQKTLTVADDIIQIMDRN